MSVLPPGGHGMMMRIDLSGQPAAEAMDRKRFDASRSPRTWRPRDLVFM
jgi:hypothetical protein